MVIKMTELEFIKQAEEFGYTDEEIQDFLDFHKESGILFDDMLLIERIID